MIIADNSMIKSEKQDSYPYPLEIWGGVECTVNRVGEQFYDQLVWNGHHSRPEDLTRFADLGIRAIRYPVLWERTAPDDLQNVNWQWSDERLNILRSLSIRPIIGLVHHGSGPRYTNLLDTAFPQKFGEYARKVAERYPWVTEYTPINEPLTTARFSGLYGHWYPHLTDAQSFIRILINEVRGTQQAMQAIREINPDAQLIQTEDIGKVYSCPSLEYQAHHENERRWLTFDLLCGRVDQQHPLFDYLTWLGVTPKELEEIQRHASPPDILGINYYVTSERYLDDRIDLFPEWMHGSNGHDTYVDLEAVRVCLNEQAGHAGILQEAWNRYHFPLALTEVHLGGYREQQLRWWVNAWNAVHTLQQRDVDIRAITAWSLLGSFNWNNLVTQDAGYYETGVFDVSNSNARPTLVADAIKAVSKNDSFDHPILDSPGWWQSPERLLHPPVRLIDSASSIATPPSYKAEHMRRPILIIGFNETLNQAFQQICDARKISFVAPSHHQFDLTDEKSIAQLLTQMHPWAVIHTTLYHSAGESTILVQQCALHGIAFLSFSTDLNVNSDNVMEVEEDARILEANPQALIIRADSFLEEGNFANLKTHISQSVSTANEFTATADVTVLETYIPELVHTSLDLLIDGEKGIWHLTKDGEATLV